MPRAARALCLFVSGLPAVACGDASQSSASASDHGLSQGGHAGSVPIGGVAGSSISSGGRSGGGNGGGTSAAGFAGEGAAADGMAGRPSSNGGAAAGAGGGSGGGGAAGSTSPCTAQVGELHAQPIESGGMVRHYFLYVPPSYDCHGAAWPLLIDFHGTASGAEADRPEEYYALPGLMSEADSLGFLVARPRSLSAAEGGSEVFQWDIHPGDLARNETFAKDLVTSLEGQYTIDPARVYSVGFSNGTNMASQFLGDSPPVFHGLAVIGGGLWGTADSLELGDPGERVYAATGFREYLYPYQAALLATLSTAGLPDGQLFTRATNAAHELYGWHYRELFQWLDKGIKPAPGSLSADWTEVPGPPTKDDLLKLASAPDGSLLVSANHGDIWRRAAASATWVSAGHIEGPDAYTGAITAPNLAGLCMGPSGEGVAVGNGVAARTTDGGLSWKLAAPIATVDPFGFAASEMFTVACSQSLVAGGGYTAVDYSTDGGASWHAGSAPGLGDFPGQLNTAAVGPSGTWVTAGYYGYIGRSVDGGQTYAEVDPSPAIQWFNGLASATGDHFWTVGEAGSIFASDDDGMTWEQQVNPSVEDLYAVAFVDQHRGIAVGAHGVAVTTEDGGATWTDVSTGLDGYLGDVAWQDPHTAIAVGEGARVFLHVQP